MFSFIYIKNPENKNLNDRNRMSGKKKRELRNVHLIVTQKIYVPLLLQFSYHKNCFKNHRS